MKTCDCLELRNSERKSYTADIVSLPAFIKLSSTPINCKKMLLECSIRIKPYLASHLQVESSPVDS